MYTIIVCMYIHNRASDILKKIFTKNEFFFDAFEYFTQTRNFF